MKEPRESDTAQRTADHRNHKQEEAGLRAQSYVGSTGSWNILTTAGRRSTQDEQRRGEEAEATGRLGSVPKLLGFSKMQTKNRLIAKNSKSQYIDKDFFGEVNKYNCFALVESAGQS